MQKLLQRRWLVNYAHDVESSNSGGIFSGLTFRIGEIRRYREYHIDDLFPPFFLSCNFQLGKHLRWNFFRRNELGFIPISDNLIFWFA